MRRVGYETSQRGTGCWKGSDGKYLKTTSEWLQSSPVIPLSIKMKWFYICRGGEAGYAGVQRRTYETKRVEPREKLVPFCQADDGKRTFLFVRKVFCLS